MGEGRVSRRAPGLERLAFGATDKGLTDINTQNVPEIRSTGLSQNRIQPLLGRERIFCLHH